VHCHFHKRELTQTALYNINISSSVMREDQKLYYIVLPVHVMCVC